jgi:hypothetical protein
LKKKFKIEKSCQVEKKCQAEKSCHDMSCHHIVSCHHVMSSRSAVHNIGDATALSFIWFILNQIHFELFTKCAYFDPNFTVFCRNVKGKSRFSQKLRPESFKLLYQSDMNQDKVSAQWIFSSSKGKHSDFERP